MNLFKVFASLVLDTSEYEQGLEDSEKEARSFGSRIGSGLATAGKVIGGAVAAGGAAVGALTTQAINGYAAYEQLVGGVETLFGDSARKVEDFANIAFKTAGLSANEYMETVTSFSASLLQSLGGDTAKAADYADTAIRDMSDNANKMGTSMGMIQNAYQDLAKQNYTMLDNLKLGYGGTKGEMERLILDAEKLNESFKATRDENGDLALSYADVVDAIHIVQQNMGITGTTAKEAAGTISGSAGSVKAAWQNLVVSLANDNADLGAQIDIFVDSALSMVDNMLPRVGVALEGVGELIEKGLPKVLDLVIDILNKNLPKLTEQALNMIKTVFTSLVQNAPQLVRTIASTITKLAKSVAKELPKAIPALVDGILNVIKSIVDELPTFLDALLELVDGLIEGIVEAIPRLIAALPKLIQGIVDFIVKAIPKIVEAAGKLLGGIIEAIPDIVKAIGEAMPDIINAIVGGLFAGVGELGRAAGELFGIIPNKAKEAGEEYQKAIDEGFAWRDIVADIEPVIADYDKLISSQGRTVSELQTDIDKAESEITTIIANAQAEQRKLRQDELTEIENYVSDIRRLEDEKLGIYRSQQRAELRKLSLEADEIQAKDVEQYLANLDAALKKSNDVAADIYTNELTRIENLWNTGAIKSKEAYDGMIKTAKADYDKMKGENQKYYDDAVILMQSKTSEMVDLNDETWARLYRNTKAAHINQKNADENFLKGWINEFYGAHDEIVNDFKDTFSDIDYANTNAWLNMIAATQTQGGKLTEESAQELDSLLAIWEEMPERMQEDVGNESMRMLVMGMEEYIPALKNSGNMTAGEIAKAIRRTLLNGDYSTYTVGEDTIKGIMDGMESQRRRLNQKAVDMASSVLRAMKTSLEIASPSKVFRDVIGKNIVLGLSKGLDEYAYYAYDSMSALSEGLTASAETDIGGGELGRTRGGVSVVQNIYAQEMSPAEAFEEAMNQQERWYFLNV